MQCVIETLFQRAVLADQLVTREIRSNPFYKPYEFEGMIKYIVFKIAYEISILIRIISDDKLSKKVIKGPKIQAIVSKI